MKLLPLITFITAVAALGNIAFAATQVPMDVPMPYTSGKGSTTFGELVEGKKALLVEFWSTKCPYCIKAIPKLQGLKERMAKKKIDVVAVNTDNMSKAEQHRKQLKTSVTWLKEPNSNPYKKSLQIRKIPTMVLIRSDGTVLYQGHPDAKELQQAIEKV